MRHLTRFSMIYGGRTNIFANATGYSISPSHSERVDSTPELHGELTREIYLLGLFREGDSHPETIFSAMAFTIFNEAQRLPVLTEFTVNSTYKCHSTSWAEKIMIITLREFAKRCRFRRNLSWTHIGDFVRQFVKFGVQVDEPRVFQSMWKELLTSIDYFTPVIDYMPAAGGGLSTNLSPLSLPTSSNSSESQQNFKLANACRTSTPPPVEITRPGCSAFSPEDWDYGFLADLKSRRRVVRVEPLPTLEPQPITSPPESLLRPDFGVGWLACGGQIGRAHV